MLAWAASAPRWVSVLVTLQLVLLEVVAEAVSVTLYLVLLEVVAEAVAED